MMDSAEYNRKFGASPLFRKKNGSTIASGAYLNFDLEIDEPTSQKYLPMNLLSVANNDASNYLSLYVDGVLFDYIQPGTVRSYNRSTLPGFVRVTLKNEGSGTISANTVFIVAQREAVDSGEVVRAVHKKIVQG